MKRKIAIVMVSVLTVLTLAACGDKANTDASTDTNTSTDAPVAAEPIESVVEESVVAEPSVEQATGPSVVEYKNNLSKSTAKKYNLEYNGTIVLDGDTPTEVLEALLDEEELGSMYLYADPRYYEDPDAPEYRQEIADVLIKNEELRYSH